MCAQPGRMATPARTCQAVPVTTPDVPVPALPPDATRAPPDDGPSTPTAPGDSPAAPAPAPGPVGEPPAASHPAGDGTHRGNRRPRTRTLLVGALLVALTASNGWMWAQQRQTRRDLDAVRAATATRDAKLVAGLRALRRDLAQVPDSPQGQQRVQDLVACVNQFIDTIGRWSTDIRSSFTYYFC